MYFFFFFSSRRRHTRCLSDWSSDVCSSDLVPAVVLGEYEERDQEGIDKRLAQIQRQKAQGERVLPMLPAASLERPHAEEIGRARVGKECRSRWWWYH